MTLLALAIASAVQEPPVNFRFLDKDLPASFDLRAAHQLLMQFARMNAALDLEGGDRYRRILDPQTPVSVSATEKSVLIQVDGIQASFWADGKMRSLFDAQPMKAVGGKRRTAEEVQAEFEGRNGEALIAEFAAQMQPSIYAFKVSGGGRHYWARRELNGFREQGISLKLGSRMTVVDITPTLAPSDFSLAMEAKITELEGRNSALAALTRIDPPPVDGFELASPIKLLSPLALSIYKDEGPEHSRWRKEGRARPVLRYAMVKQDASGRRQTIGLVDVCAVTGRTTGISYPLPPAIDKTPSPILDPLVPASF